MSISAPFRAEISFTTFPLPAVSASSLFSQQWVVVRLEGQHHELMYQIAGQSHQGEKAEISKQWMTEKWSFKASTRIMRRVSFSVSLTMCIQQHSFLLSLITMLLPKNQ